MPRHLILLPLFLISLNSLTQTHNIDNYNSLLWRVEGNGLSKPSYLFGTVHLTDKRVFFFGDSLYKSLEQCEGFAAELDLRNIIDQYLNEVFSEERQGETRYLIDDMDEDLISKYKSGLEKKFKKPLNKITEADLKQEEKWMQRRVLQGEMSTFMDAHLFEIARKQGKWVGGIEDFSDQFSKVANTSLEDQLQEVLGDKSEMNKKLEWMINTYLKQDLESIDKSDELWQGGKDFILISRNAKMSRRIDSLSRIRSCLFAIGAAHLPGDSGLVNLLRHRGFSVTPVYSSQKIAPEKYTFKEVDFPWARVYSRDSTYAIEMPSEPNSIQTLQELPYELKLNFDLGAMRVYFMMNIPIPEERANQSDSLMRSVVERYKAKSRSIQQKDILHENMKGKELLSITGTEAYRMQIFLIGNHLALNFIYAYKKDNLFGSGPDHFFNSFNVLQREPKRTNDSSSLWKTYTFNGHGFSIQFPGKFIERKLKSSESWYQHQYEYVDLSGGGCYYGIVINEAKPGYYSNEDSAYFDQTAESLKQTMNAELLSSSHLFYHNFPAYMASLRAKVERENVQLKIMMVNRGNRRYYLVTSYYPDKAPKDMEQFFSSLTLLPIASAEWRQSASPHDDFSIWSPSEVRPYFWKDQFYVYDSATATSVYIAKKTLPSYYWAASDSELLDRQLQSYMGWNDSLLSSKKIVAGNIKGLDILVLQRGNQNLRKARVWLNGDTLYSIYGYLPQEQLESDNYQKLFDKFIIKNVSVPSLKLYTRKPADLLKALSSKDSLEFETAKEVFSEVKFEAADLPLLEKSLLVKHRDFDSNNYDNVNLKIIKLVQELDSSYTAVSFVRTNYKNIPAENECLKPLLLSLLSAEKCHESYTLLKEILTAQPPRLNVPYYIQTHFYDSLALSRVLYPEILSVIDDKNLFTIIAGLTVTLLDSGLIDKTMVEKYKDQITRLARRELARNKDELEQEAYQYHSLVNLLGALNTAECNTLLNRFMKLSDKRIRLTTLIALLKNNQAVNRVDLYTLAVNDEFRIDLYDELKKIGKEKFFPSEFLSQKELAQSRVYGVAISDLDGEIPTLNFIAEKTVLFKGKPQKFYLFKMSTGPLSESSYLAIAGPYSPNAKEYSSNHEATAIYWDEAFDKGKVDDFFKKHLEAVIND